MLGIALTFVGIVLVHNGIMFMSNSVVKNEDGTESVVPLIVHSPKSIAFFNVIVGLILVVGNLILLAFHSPMLPQGENAWWFSILTQGLVFGVTYLFIAANLLFKLDMRPFGFYCLAASVFAIFMVYESFNGFLLAGGFDLPLSQSHGLWLGLLWITWFVLWFAGALQFTFKWKPMDKIFPWISISVGIVGAFVPAMFLLLGTWQLL